MDDHRSPDDEFDDEPADFEPAEPSAHWGRSTFDSLEAMRWYVSDQLDALLGSLAGEGSVVGARFLIDAMLDCRVEFFADDEAGSTGAGESLFILARDRYGLAAPELVTALFGYLIEDLLQHLGEIDDSQIEEVFADGERPLALLGGDGLPLDLTPALQRSDAW